jgi:hypothetical protein
MASEDIYIPYPAKGLSETYGYAFQEELTSRDERNMRTRDPRTGRFRGAQRAGMSIFRDNEDQLNSTEKIRNIAVIPVSANTGDSSSVRTALAVEHEGTVINSFFDQERVLRSNSSGEFCVYTEAVGFGLMYVYNEDMQIVKTASIVASDGPDYVPRVAFPDDLGYLLFARGIQLFVYDLYSEPEPFLVDQHNISTETGSQIHDMVLLNGKLYILLVKRDDLDVSDVPAGTPRTESSSDVACQYKLVEVIDYTQVGTITLSEIHVHDARWQDGSLADHFDGSHVAGDSRFAPPSACYWKNPGYRAVGRLSTSRNASGSLLCVSISNERWGYTAVHDLDSTALVPMTTFGQGVTAFNFRPEDDTNWNVAASRSYIGDTRALLGTGSGCQPVPDAASSGVALFSSIGNTRWDAATTQTLTITGSPTAGDSLVVAGPRESDGTICTLTIEFVSGHVSSGFPVRVTATATSCTVTVSLGSVSASVNTVAEWAGLIDACYVMAVWYIKDTTYGSSSNPLYSACAPNSVIARVTPDWPSGTSTGELTITHPDVRTTLTSTSYVQVNGTWTDRTDAAQTVFTNATATPNMRMHAAPGDTQPTEAWSYDLGGMTATQLREQTIHVDKTGNTYFAPRGDAYNFGGAKGLLVVPYDYATTSTAFKLDDTGSTDTTIDRSQNVLPSRFGEGFETGVGISNEVMGAMAAYRTLDYDTGLNGTGRTVYVAAVAGDTLKQHTASGYTAPTNNAVFDTNGYVDSAVGFERAYYTDGIKYWAFNPVKGVNGDVEELVASAGSIPQFCQLISYWRDRLVIAREAPFPGTWHMSKVGDPTNWDFVPDVPTVIDAVSSSTSQAGQVPDAINAVIPWTDDLLLFGGDSTLWALAGDPLAANSFFDLISDQTGVAFGHAWCKDPEGNLWFFGSDGGLYFMQPQSRPVRVSLNSVEYQLRSIDFTSYRVELAWNPVDEGVHIMQVPKGGGGALIDHWFYEVPTQSWHKDRFGIASTDLIQPTCLRRANGDLPQDRVLLLGGEDGRIRCLPDSVSSIARSDEKTNSTNVAIDSYVTIGPMVNTPYQGATQLTEFGAVLSPTGNGCNYEFFSTDEPENLGDAVARGTLQPGRNDRRLVRISGDHLFMRLRNASPDECWAWEGGYAKQDYGGDLRR